MLSTPKLKELAQKTENQPKHSNATLGKIRSLFK